MQETDAGARPRTMSCTSARLSIYNEVIVPSALRSMLVRGALLLVLLVPSIGSAAFAVYADSWETPTQAQEQATRVNRSLGITSATYERATVRGRVFWRVRIGVYRLRDDATAMRARLHDTGVADSWMREVDDDQLAEPAPAPDEPAEAAVDSVSIDSLSRALIDSIARVARRRVDSLEIASQHHLDGVIRQMRGQLSREVIRQLESEQARERATYVTQAEQAQMTRALLDEMYSNFHVLRDSLRRARERRLKVEALLPDISGSVAATTGGEHSRPDGGPVSTNGSIQLSEVRARANWGNPTSEVRFDLRAASGVAPEVRQAFASWTFARDDTVSRTLGMGVVERPYGLEPVEWAGGLASVPSLLTRMRRDDGPVAGLWLVPYQTERVRVLVMPYGAWDEDAQSAWAQLRLTWPQWRGQLAIQGERGRGSPTPDVGKFRALSGDLVVGYKGESWRLGLELYGRLQRETWSLNHAERDSAAYGVALLVHKRITSRWGWTARGDAILDRSEWLKAKIACVQSPCVWPDAEPRRRHGTFITGPLFSLAPRLTMSLMYELDAELRKPDTDDGERLSHRHRLHFGMSHVF